MSATAATPRAAAGATRSTLLAYRDDGPLARALGSALGRRLPLPTYVLHGLGLLPAAIAAAVARDGASHALLGAVLAWLILCAGAASGRPHDDRLRWAAPPLLRAGEYGGLIWIAAIAGGNAPPAAFALLCALAFRHYDLVYRLRHRGVEPPAWVGNLALGWEGRLILGFVLLVAGALPVAFYVLAGVLAVVFVAESVAGWVGAERAPRAAVSADQEEEEAE